MVEKQHVRLLWPTRTKAMFVRFFVFFSVLVDFSRSTGVGEGRRRFPGHPLGCHRAGGVLGDCLPNGPRSEVRKTAGVSDRIGPKRRLWFTSAEDLFEAYVTACCCRKLKSEQGFPSMADEAGASRISKSLTAPKRKRCNRDDGETTTCRTHVSLFLIFM